MNASLAGLQDLIERYISVIPARVGLYLRVLDKGWEVSYRGERIFSAASVIKIPLLMAVLQCIMEGELDWEQEVPLRNEHKVGGAGVLMELHEGIKLSIDDLCRLMIVVSDNTASNLLLKMVGMNKVSSLCEKWGLRHTKFGRYFMEEAVAGNDNFMSPIDAADCLTYLWRGEVLDRKWCDYALNVLRRQQYREKIPLMLGEDVTVANKTGELIGVRHDAALIEAHFGAYVLVVFTDKGEKPWQVDLGIARLSLSCYRYLEAMSYEN